MTICGLFLLFWLQNVTCMSLSFDYCQDITFLMKIYSCNRTMLLNMFVYLQCQKENVENVRNDIKA